MSIWLVRAGKFGEFEQKFIENKRIYLTWDDLNINITKFKEKKDLTDYFVDNYENTNGNRNRAANWSNQVWAFSHSMEKGDWVVLPSKLKSAIHFGEIKSDYIYDEKLGSPYFHFRNVKWFAMDIPRINFDQDILFSLGAAMTICRIHRNDAEKRLKKMFKNNWISKPFPPSEITDHPDVGENEVDLEQIAYDAIAKYLIRKYKGSGMERIIEAILIAQGYTTYRSPEGADNGVDLLAATGPLGFGSPRICVQVKTSDVPIDLATLDRLIGTMQNYNAEQGLLVSWNGFKNSVDKEVANKFFQVRLWDQKVVISELLKNYNNLDPEIKNEIPLKQIWTLSTPTDD